MLPTQLISGSQQQWEQYGNSDVLRALNSDLDYDPVLNGHLLLAQGNTSAPPTQASVSAVSVRDSRDTNKYVAAVEFYHSFL